MLLYCQRPISKSFLLQLTLIRAGWNELLIAGFSFRSTRLEDGILWADGQVITRYEHAHINVVSIYE